MKKRAELPQKRIESRTSTVLKATVALTAVAAAIYAFSQNFSGKVREVVDAGSDSHENKLFRKVEVDPNLDRTKIPEILPGMIAGFGKVVQAPKVYNPKLPNLYLIGNHHFPTGNDPMVKNDADLIYLVQEENLRIFHELRRTGVNRQYVEGLPKGEEFKHDVVRNNWDENSLTAMPKYKATGKIHRARTAIEGTYEGDVESVGAENISEVMTDQQEFNRLDRQFFWPARKQIVFALAREFGINVRTELIENGDYLTTLSSEIRKKVSAKKPEEVQAIVDKFVMQNSYFREWLQKVPKIQYGLSQQRNIVMAEFVNMDMQKRPTDTAFILGSDHIYPLIELLKGMNVFALEAKDFRQENSNKDAMPKTEDDYRKLMLQNDLYAFGLTTKLPKSIF